MECRCGSGECRYPLYDGHGIFLTYACSSYEGEKLKGFRPDIFEQYDTDEPQTDQQS
jgi:hypothetical protein